MIISNKIDMTDTMYPSTAIKAKNEIITLPENSTVYGYVLNGDVDFGDRILANTGQYFCQWINNQHPVSVEGEAVFFVRFGFKGQNNIGGPLEKSGRLCYIDGCSDSLLIYPPRLGDASLNVLYFPSNVEQSFHIHPSIRFGVVVSGEGVACLSNKEIELKPGNMFCIEERENHRFKTEKSPMIVIAFHPDGDWGPTDHNHTMLNRTYVK